MASKFGNMLLGLVLGGAVGYVYAMLNAERTGEETRMMLEERGRELRARAVDTINETKDKTGKLVEQGREQINEKLNRTLEKASDLQDQGTNIVTEKRVAVSDTLHKVADSLDPYTPSGDNPAPSDPNITPSI